MSVIDATNGPRKKRPRPRRASAVPIGDLMTTARDAAALEAKAPLRHSLNALATVREATHLMASRGLAQIHVLDVRGRVVGVLTTSDLYRWVADGALDDDDDFGGRA
jgi:CBS domain-containing protein